MKESHKVLLFVLHEKGLETFTLLVPWQGLVPYLLPWE